ncbi:MULTISPECIES: hypothetical protein [unclassified Nocardiopsis]|uniref:hypothetical protein n=1 Tax=Nocardiopsis TaxID=2013 RepID=UPI00387AB9C6
MSGLGKWSLGLGAGLLVVAVLCSVLDLIPVSVITGILGLIGVGMAGYDALYNWLQRIDLRRRGAAAQARRNGEGR